MPGKRVQLHEVTGLLVSLEEVGARDIRRSRVDPHGLVEIRWRLSPAEEAREAAVRRAARTAIALAALFAAVLVAVLLVTVL